MALYGLAQRTSATAAASASWEILTAATNAPLVMEVGISQNTATAGVYGLGRPAVIGGTPTTPQNFVAEQNSTLPTSITKGALAWGVGPTVPANHNRRVSCSATIGVGVIWTFPRGFHIPVSSSIVVWIIATAPVCDVWAVIDE